MSLNAFTFLFTIHSFHFWHLNSFQIFNLIYDSIQHQIYQSLFFRMNNNTMFSIWLALCRKTKLEVQGFIERKIWRTMSNIEAEKSFWMTPELMENLLSFLDPGSILALAKSLGKTHSLNTKLLLSGTVWTKFLERSFPKQSSTLRMCFPWFPQHFATGRTNIHPSIVLEPIIKILLLIGKPESHLLQLLDLICDRFPPYISERGTPDHVKVVCPCHEVHDVSPFGFGLLEKVERSTDTCHQQVDAIRMWSMCMEHVKYACEPILSIPHICHRHHRHVCVKIFCQV